MHVQFPLFTVTWGSMDAKISKCVTFSFNETFSGMSLLFNISKLSVSIWKLGFNNNSKMLNCFISDHVGRSFSKGYFYSKVIVVFQPNLSRCSLLQFKRKFLLEFLEMLKCIFLNNEKQEFAIELWNCSQWEMKIVDNYYVTAKQMECWAFYVNILLGGILGKLHCKWDFFSQNEIFKKLLVQSWFFSSQPPFNRCLRGRESIRKSRLGILKFKLRKKKKKKHCGQSENAKLQIYCIV